MRFLQQKLKVNLQNLKLESATSGVWEIILLETEEILESKENLEPT